ncbi:MAG: hypothetical protein JWP14_2009 [Frankiales bacterium]|nr:hypothetical protein [Frankiales bacterium]
MKRLGVWAPTVLMPTSPLPFPLDQPGVRLSAKAREGLRDALFALGLRPGDEVLVPSWHHGSEVEAHLRGGLVCRAYPLGPDLQPQEDALEALLSRRTRALHLTHALGFPQDVARWRRWCDRHGLLLVEDAAQAWLAERDGVPVGSVGDAAVFCLYKSVGLPDGAAVLASAPVPRPAQRGAAGLRHLAGPVIRALPRRSGVYDHRADVAIREVSRRPSALSRALLPRAGAAQAAAGRRAAYVTLLPALQHLVLGPFAALPDGASPFVFPIAVRDKAAALRHLGVQGIDALDLWSVGHSALGDGGELVRSLRRHVLGLPVHQWLSASDLARVVAAAERLDPHDALVHLVGPLPSRVDGSA